MCIDYSFVFPSGEPSPDIINNDKKKPIKSDLRTECSIQICRYMSIIPLLVQETRQEEKKREEKSKSNIIFNILII